MTILCAESIEEARVLREENIGLVYFAKEEMANNMSAHILEQIASAHRQVQHS